MGERVGERKIEQHYHYPSTYPPAYETVNFDRTWLSLLLSSSTRYSTQVQKSVAETHDTHHWIDVCSTHL